MIGRSSKVVALIALVMVQAAGCSRCKKDARPAALDDDDTPTAPSAAPSAVASAPVWAPSRCVPIGGAYRLGDRAQALGVELGGVAADARGFFVGARVPNESAAVVLQLSLSGGDAGALPTTATLDPTAAIPWFRTTEGEPQAPRVALNKDRLVAATVGHSERGWPMRVDSLSAPNQVSRVFEVVQHIDESEWTNVALTDGGVVLAAWDEVDTATNRGRVLVRTSAAPGTTQAFEAGAGGDASEPQLVTLGDRVVLLWIAEAEDHAGEEDAEPSGGAQRMHRWVEGVQIDPATLHPIGTVRALTAKDGHALAVSVQVMSPGFVLLTRDDQGLRDGDGRLIATQVTMDTAGVGSAQSQVVVERDVAPGMAWLVTSHRTDGAPATWVVHSHADETTSLVPVFGTRGLPSMEPGLRRRSVALTNGDVVLSSLATGGELELQMHRCGDS